MYSLPFVRCVGIGTSIYQDKLKKAYDYRMIYIIKGNGIMEIDDKVLNTDTNSIYIISPGTPYRVCSSENQQIAVINFDTNYDYSHIEKPVLSVDVDLFNDDEILSTPFPEFLKDSSFKVSATCTELFEEIYQTYLRDDISGDMKNFLLSSKLIYIFSKALTLKTISSTSAEIYNYIINNASKKITAKDIGQEFNYSGSYIEKLLRKDYNTSLKQLILDTRLKKSMWLLENTSLTISEISHQLGFHSSQHFTEMFKKKFRRLPSQIK